MALKRYKHPYKNTRLFLDDKLSISIVLRDFVFQTEDEGIQELLKGHPIVKEMTEAETKKADVVKPGKPSAKYSEGVSKLRLKRGK